MESIRNYFDENPMAKGIAVTGCGLIASLIARRVLELTSPRFSSVVGTLGFIASPIAGLAAASKTQEFPEYQEGFPPFLTVYDGEIQWPTSNGPGEPGSSPEGETPSAGNGSVKEEERAPSADGAPVKSGAAVTEAIE